MTKNTLTVIGIVLGVLVVFSLGAAVGYRRALFASRFGEEYSRNFGVPGPMGMGVPTGPMSFSMHGVAGRVIDVASASLAVDDPQGNEQSVAVVPATVIREDDDTILIDAIEVGDMITAIGGPNQDGQIEARFIRVFPASSSMPVGQ